MSDPVAKKIRVVGDPNAMADRNNSDAQGTVAVATEVAKVAERGDGDRVVPPAAAAAPPAQPPPFQYTSRGLNPKLQFGGNWNRGRGYSATTLNPNALQLNLPSYIEVQRDFIGALRAQGALKPVFMMIDADNTVFIGRIDTEFSDAFRAFSMRQVNVGADVGRPLARIARETPSSVVFQFPSGVTALADDARQVTFDETKIIWLGEIGVNNVPIMYTRTPLPPTQARLDAASALFLANAKYAHLYCVNPAMIVEHEFELTRYPESKLEEANHVRAVSIEERAVGPERFVWPFEIDQSGHLEQTKVAFVPESGSTTQLLASTRTYAAVPISDIDRAPFDDAFTRDRGFYMDDADRRRLLRSSYTDKLPAAGEVARPVAYTITWIAGCLQFHLNSTVMLTMTINWRLFTRQFPVEYYLAQLLFGGNDRIIFYCEEDSLPYWFGLFGSNVTVEMTERRVNSSQYKVTIDLPAARRTADYRNLATNIDRLRPSQTFKREELEKSLFL